MNTVYITEKDRLIKNENNLVDIHLANGDVIEKVEPKRMFPTSNPNAYITFINGEETQAAMLKDVSVLDESSKKVLDESLQDYYMVPIISRINNSYEKYGVMYFDVETDRGRTLFNIRNRHHDVKTYPGGSVRMRDSSDNRYLIPDVNKLDKKSLSYLFIFL